MFKERNLGIVENLAKQQRKTLQIVSDDGLMGELRAFVKERERFADRKTENHFWSFHSLDANFYLKSLLNYKNFSSAPDDDTRMVLITGRDFFVVLDSFLDDKQQIYKWRLVDPVTWDTHGTFDGDLSEFYEMTPRLMPKSVLRIRS